MQLLDVALPVPVPRLFSYAPPRAAHEPIRPGQRVVCPFGGRRLVGVVMAVREGEPPASVKEVAQVLDPEPLLSEDLIAFLREVSSYYLAPIGEVLKLALPPLEKDAVRAVKEPTLFDEGGGIGVRLVAWVEATAEVGDMATLKGQAAAVLAHVRAVGAVPLASLEGTWGNARAAVKKLEARGLVRVDRKPAKDNPFFERPVARDDPPPLTGPQSEAVARIEAALRGGEAKTFLLHGVTGSGKTEVYLRAIATARSLGRAVAVLVPEIALTPQLVARYRARFGDDVAVVHSALTPKERLGMWRKLQSGSVDVVIGARSALFAPLRKLGLVLVDEEHDSSFKQEEGVRYHARDMAILRAHRVSGVCVLGSATPSLESLHLTQTGKAERLRLPDRARAQAMPEVTIVDLRRMGAGPTGEKRLSLPLHRALAETLEAKEQAILFLNRRGFAPSVRCEACGELASCPSCSVALTFHRGGPGVLRCHYCDYQVPIPEACPKCNAPALALEGMGTEKLEEALQQSFPSARIARLDRDVASGKAIEGVLERVRSGEVDVLVGTQMVTKGHDLPNVTLVGVINADAALGLPDFRAAERAFQLLVQVAGRAGRGDKPGRVLVQTYDPQHPAIRFGVRHDVEGFVAEELASRRELAYPPWSRVALVRVDSLEEDAARDAARRLGEVARAVARGVDVLGPAPAPLARLRSRYRFRVMLRSADRGRLRACLLAIEAERAQVPRTVRVALDVDPVQLL